MPTIKLNAHLSAVLKSAPYVSDAPNDGITYGRKDSKWVPVQTEIKTENTQTIELLVDEETSTLSANLIKAKPVSDSRAITVEIGLSPSNLNYTQPNTKVYAKNTDSNTFGWVSLPEPSPARTVVAGTGILVAEYGSTSDIVSLSQEVQNKLARIPDLPTGDGNYALTCTITGGVPTFAWTLAN